MNKNVEVVIQARMGSTRLPGKVMTNLAGKPVLWHVLERVKQANYVDQIVIATTKSKEDDALCDYIKLLNIPYYRGEEMDVLGRYYDTLQQYPADSIVRITSDCPLIDPYIIDQVILAYQENPCEYASNVGDIRTYPRGLDCEIFSYKLLERAYKEAVEPYEREHVTPFMYWKQKKIVQVYHIVDYSNMRWTLDTDEDYQLILKIYSQLYHGKHDFYMEDICDYIKKHPEIQQINEKIEQKPTK